MAWAQPIALPPIRGMIVAQRGDVVGKVNLESDEDEGRIGEKEPCRLALAASSNLVKGSLDLDFSSGGVAAICDGLDFCDSSFI